MPRAFSKPYYAPFDLSDTWNEGKFLRWENKYYDISQDAATLAGLIRHVFQSQHEVKISAQKLQGILEGASMIVVKRFKDKDIVVIGMVLEAVVLGLPFETNDDKIVEDIFKNLAIKLQVNKSFTIKNVIPELLVRTLYPNYSFDMQHYEHIVNGTGPVMLDLVPAKMHEMYVQLGKLGSCKLSEHLWDHPAYGMIMYYDSLEYNVFTVGAKSSFPGFRMKAYGKLQRNKKRRLAYEEWEADHEALRLAKTLVKSGKQHRALNEHYVYAYSKAHKFMAAYLQKCKRFEEVFYHIMAGQTIGDDSMNNVFEYFSASDVDGYPSDGVEEEQVESP